MVAPIGHFGEDYNPFKRCLTMMANKNQPLLRAVARELADILADALVNDLRTDILRRLPAEPIARTESQGRSHNTQDLGVLSVKKVEARTLWTLKDLALDSGIKVSTWRRGS
jgi:hypothetical protein